MSIRLRSTTYLGESQVSVAQALMRKLLFMKQNRLSRNASLNQLVVGSIPTRPTI